MRRLIFRVITMEGGGSGSQIIFLGLFALEDFNSDLSPTLTH
jgi:hypothetical protein